MYEGIAPKRLGGLTALLFALVLSASSITAQTSDVVGRVVELNGMEMYYEVSGEGEPLILLHHFSQSGTTWASMVPELARLYRVIVPDLRGHGRSTNPSKQFTLRQWALDIFALLDLLEITRFKAMGASGGGMALLHMATQQPARVEGMVLIGAATYFPEQARAIFRTFPVQSPTPEIHERWRQIHKRGDEQIRTLRQQFHSFKDSYDDMNFTQPYLSKISARTLIVYGDRDRFFPVEIALEMYRGIPNAALWVIPQGVHVPIFDPAVPFLPTALKFLQAKGQ